MGVYTPYPWLADLVTVLDKMGFDPRSDIAGMAGHDNSLNVNTLEIQVPNPERRLDVTIIMSGSGERFVIP